MAISSIKTFLAPCVVVIAKPFPVVKRNSDPCPTVKSSLFVPFISSLLVVIFTLLFGTIFIYDGMTSLKKNTGFVLELLVIVVFPPIKILLESQTFFTVTPFVSLPDISESIILVIP